MEVCCTKTRREQQCALGRQAALAGLECGVPGTQGQVGVDTYKDCCLSCTLGIVVASMAQRCSGMSSVFGCPLEEPFVDCCQEILNPLDNQTLIPDNLGVDDEESEDIETTTMTQVKVTTEEDKNSQCPSGFEYNGLLNVCDDIDECLDAAQHSCYDDEVCYNTIGSYECDIEDTSSDDCAPGYRFFLVTCIDINECFEDKAACPDGEICVNTEGNYTCETPEKFKEKNACPLGFKESSGKCEDLNECQTGEHNCLESQRCDNTLGSFVCTRYTTCGTGYTLNYASGKCEDNNECALGTHNCGALGPEYFCRNMQGSFRCEKKKCNIGEILDEEGLCMKLSCGTGFEAGPLGNCIDVDECYSGDACQPGERCINTMGSFECISMCEIGLRLNSRSGRCEDIDECITGMASCYHGASCVNTIGSYKCSCGPGYKSVNGVCEDIDECTRNGQKNRFVCGIDSECQNSPGSYRCICKQGFKHVGRSCADVNECEEIPNICGHDCTNLWGSYRCHCREGYQLSSDTRTCSDIDECEDPNRCIGACINEPGSYKCDCPSGYRISANGRTCEDIDECKEESPCRGNHQYCHNTRGGYKCANVGCPQGYQKESSHSNRCKRTSRRCRSTDFVCLRKPVSISFNFMSLISNLQVGGSGIDLFTMQSARYEQITTKFTLKVINIIAQPGVTPVTKSSFRLKTGMHQATLTLSESIQGPQDVELELLMEMYYQARFTGSALARIYIFVTPYEF
jgi:fibulin 1/2